MQMGTLTWSSARNWGDEVVFSTSTAEIMEDKQAKKEHVPAWPVRLWDMGADDDQSDFCGAGKLNNTIYPSFLTAKPA